MAALFIKRPGPECTTGRALACTSSIGACHKKLRRFSDADARVGRFSPKSAQIAAGTPEAIAAEAGAPMPDPVECGA
jgi:hypothetical protein